MSLDLIKQYLVGIGFNVDSNSLKTAQDSMTQADESVKKFNDDSNKGFSETSGALKDLFKLFSSSEDLIKSLSLTGPFKEIIKYITLAKKLYSQFNAVFENKNKNDVQQKVQENKPEKKKKERSKGSDTKTPNTKHSAKKHKNSKIKTPKADESAKTKSELKKAGKQVAETSVNTANKLKDVSSAAKGLLSKGGPALKAFATTSAGAFALIGVAAVGVIAGIKALISTVKGLADDDIKFEKLSRQLWTTKENAREVSTALDTLDASMDDLWLSPTLLKQFNQLRSDLKDMKMPDDFNRNIKVVQGLGLEFKRTKQMIRQFFKLIGSYVLKYIAGPLNEIKGKAHGMNDWLVQNLPKIAKAIGTIVGILLRIIMIIGKIVAVILKIGSPIIKIVQLIGKLFGAMGKLPEPIKKMLKALMLLLNPLILIIGLIDDIITYFKGGESVIGSFIDKVKGKSEAAGKVIKGILKTLSAVLTGGLSLVPWNKYWKEAKETFEKIKNKAKETYEKIKEWSKGKLEDAKEFLTGAKEKMNGFNNAVSNNTAASYVTSNKSNTDNSVTTSNSNNKVVNNNNINVYGSGDAKSTAKSTADTLTGINTRNLQPVF